MKKSMEQIEAEAEAEIQAYKELQKQKKEERKRKLAQLRQGKVSPEKPGKNQEPEKTGTDS